MRVEQIYVGSWFQRTTLHLSEIYDFLQQAESPLDLEAQKLSELKDILDVSSVEMVVGNLDHIILTSNNEVVVKIYEDGLILLKTPQKKDVREEIAKLTEYYEHKLSSALKYIFSLGAPIPKELANIKTVYPYFIVLNKATKKVVANFLSEFDQKEYFHVSEKPFEIYRGDKLYVINNKELAADVLEDFISEQIFMREFKGQLHRYLNLHRIIWERIAEVKEKGSIRGKDIGPFKTKIEGYSKAINFIEARINQMGTYVRTREAIIKTHPHTDTFHTTLGFKYETLSDTLAYTKEIWKMTKNYVSSAMDLFSELQAKATSNSIKNLTVVTSMGVGATLIGLFTEKSIPDFTWFGVLYFFILAVIGFVANYVMKKIYTNKHYSIHDIEADTHIS